MMDLGRALSKETSHSHPPLLNEFNRTTLPLEQRVNKNLQIVLKCAV